MPYGIPAVAPRIETSRSNRFLVALPPDDYARLTPHLRPLTLERGTVLHDSGDQIEQVYFPHTGMVSLVAIMRSGATIETMTVGSGGVVGHAAALGGRHAVGRAIVQLPGSASRIAATRFHAAAQESRAIHELVLQYNDLLLAQVQQSVGCNALHGLEARLCRWLLQAHDCVGGSEVPLTQEFLGQMLGVRRTSVTIAARLLQSAGMISYRRGHIHILDRCALEDAACECYATIRQQTDKAFAYAAR
jgi:CRP-like cAMP-binding protein